MMNKDLTLNTLLETMADVRQMMEPQRQAETALLGQPLNDSVLYIRAVRDEERQLVPAKDCEAIVAMCERSGVTYFLSENIPADTPVFSTPKQRVMDDAISHRSLPPDWRNYRQETKR
jgi:hypothetical protein